MDPRLLCQKNLIITIPLYKRLVNPLPLTYSNSLSLFPPSKVFLTELSKRRLCFPVGLCFHFTLYFVASTAASQGQFIFLPFVFILTVFCTVFCILPLFSGKFWVVIGQSSRLGSTSPSCLPSPLICWFSHAFSLFLSYMGLFYLFVYFLNYLHPSICSSLSFSLTSVEDH